MNVKSDISRLTELCAQRKVAPPQYDLVSSTSNKFVFIVKAFGLMAEGTGNSKQEGKHAASRTLIEKWTQLDGFEGQVKEVPSSPPPSTTSSIDDSPCSHNNNDNAVGALITLCQQRNLPFPIINDASFSGKDHMREYTATCDVGKYRTQGKAKTKKEARRRSAIEMLDLLEEISQQDASCCSNEDSSIDSDVSIAIVLPILEVPSVEDVLNQYRRMKKPYIKPATEGIRYRKNFFNELPAASQARQILLYSYLLDAKETVDQVCKMLNLKYEIKSMASPLGFARFCLLDTSYDCVIIAHIDVVFTKIIEYFKTMLNVENPKNQSYENEVNNNLQTTNHSF